MRMPWSGYVERHAFERKMDEYANRIAETLTSTVSQQMLQDAIGWTALTGRQANDYDMTSADLRKARQDSLRLWWVNGDVAQAAFLLSSGVFGRGIAMPKAVDPGVQKVIARFWEDDDNQLCLFDVSAQQRADLRFMIDGELFITVHTSEADSVVKLGLLRPNEITDVITHPNNWLRPVLYKREFVKRSYDFGMKSWKPGTEIEVEYYPAWSCANPDGTYDNEVLKLLEQAGDRLAVPGVYHVAVNTAGLRGIPEAFRSYDWGKTHARALADMATLTKALAMLAWRKKVKTKSASAISDAASMFRGPAPGPGAVAVENENVNLEPINVGTGGVSNQQATARLAHLEAIKPHGFGEHWYGDASTGNLATATAMELPAIWRIEVRQALWERVYEALSLIAIRRAISVGDFPVPRLAADVDIYMDVDFPPAQPNTPASTAQLLGALTGASGILLDEREAAYQAYVALGTNDITEVMERQFPENAEGIAPEFEASVSARESASRFAEAVAPSRIARGVEREILSRVIRPWRTKIGSWLRSQGERIPGKPSLAVDIEEQLRPNADALLVAISRGVLAAADDGGARALRRLRTARRGSDSPSRGAEAHAESRAGPGSDDGAEDAVSHVLDANDVLRAAESAGDTLAQRLARGEGADAIRKGFVFHLRDPELLAALQERGQKITGEITDSMMSDLHDVLGRQFYDQGLPPAEVAKSLDTIFPATYANRGLAIARTETGSAQNLVQRIAYKRNGVGRKQWLTLMDGNTRESHANAHGQVVGIDEPFIVGGASLQQPGDPSGPPGEIINCRCDTLPVTDDDFELPEQPWDGGIAYEKLTVLGGE